jgi:ribose transport system permease protein
MSATKEVLATNNRRLWEAWGLWFTAQRGLLISVAIFAAMFAFYGWKQEVGLSPSMINTAANKGALLALVAMAQTIPVLTGGLDLSVGMVFVFTNCLAATIVNGDARMTALGIIGVLITGLICGIINGLIVVYGRLQPIIVTLATGAVYFGLALALRPEPGGSVNFEFADFMTRSFFNVPSSVILLLAVVAFIWIPYRRSVLGRAAYAIGSSEHAAYMSGVPIARAKILAYALSGLLAAIAGLLLTALTYSGAAKALLGADYTLNSIAAVVIGGTSLFGGAGSAIGSIFGAFVMRTVGDLLIVFDINPVLQPLFVGIVLLLAVSLGSLRLLRIKNKLDLYR